MQTIIKIINDIKGKQVNVCVCRNAKYLKCTLHFSSSVITELGDKYIIVTIHNFDIPIY